MQPIVFASVMIKITLFLHEMKINGLKKWCHLFFSPVTSINDISIQLHNFILKFCCILSSVETSEDLQELLVAAPSLIFTYE